jgi:hypothetical protein
MSKATTLSSIVSDGKPLADAILSAAEVPGLATVASTGSYNDLINKPTADQITEGVNKFYRPGLQLAYSLIFRA